MKAEIVTIAGKPGSGKSTTANLVAKALGYERYSAGSIIRAIGERRGMSVEEISRQAITDHSIDEEMDRTVAEIGKTRSKLVVDGRLAFHFIPDSFKVYLELDLAIAAERIFAESADSRAGRGEHAETLDEMYTSIARRFESEQRRYYDLYKIDPNNTSHFDIIIDTTNHTPEEIAEKVVAAYQEWRTEN